MSKKVRRLQPLEVKINLTPPKKKKKFMCILNCKHDDDECITKFSKTSREVVYKAAQLRNDDSVISILDSFGENLPSSCYGYHRKCYQKYTHKRLLQKLHEETIEPEASTSTASTDTEIAVRVPSKRKCRGGKTRS